MQAINLFLSNVPHCQQISHLFIIVLSALACFISASARHKGKKFTTIAKNQWFLKVTIAIDGLVVAQQLHWDHWDNFFSFEVEGCPVYLVHPDKFILQKKNSKWVKLTWPTSAWTSARH